MYSQQHCKETCRYTEYNLATGQYDWGTQFTANKII